MTPRRWRMLRVLLGAGVLATVLAVVGTGPALTGLRALDAGTLAVAVALAFPATLACAWRWRLVARRLDAGIGLRTAVTAYYGSQFLNTTLPGGVAGDVHRGLVHGRQVGRITRGLRAVVVERVAGQLVLAAITVPALLVLPLAIGPSVPFGVAAVATGVVVTGLALGLRRLVGAAWVGVVLASVVALACHVATYLFVAGAVGVRVSTGTAATLVPLVLLVFVAAALPTNLAGWGPREGMAAWAFGAAGLGAEAGLATGVAYGAAVLVASLPGAAVLLVTRWRHGVTPGVVPAAAGGRPDG